MIKNLLMIFLLPLIIIGCSSEPLVPSEAIIGKWEATNLKEMNNRGLKQNGSADDFDPIISSISTFYLDQEFELKEVFKSGRESLNKRIYRFRLTNEFEHVGEGFENARWFSAKILSISDEKMSILYTRPDGVEIGVTDYKRVN